MAVKYYVWGTLYNGGDIKMIKDRKIIVKRNIIEPGQEITQSKLKCSDEDWDALIEGGSVRDYPYPDIPVTFPGSPAEFIMHELRQGEEEPDQDTLLELALKAGIGKNPALDDDDDDDETEAEVPTINEK